MWMVLMRYSSRSRTGAYRVLVGTPDGKRPLGRPTSRWEDNIEVPLQETLIYSGQRQVAGCCESGNERPGPFKRWKRD